MFNTHFHKPMRLQFLFIISFIFVFLGCASVPSVTVLCERDNKKNYILKWEIYPDIDNTQVEIFVSDNDSIFPTTPQLIVNSNDYIAVVKRDSSDLNKRKYFKLNIAGATSNIITNRFFELDSIQNFRDIGGYETNDNRHVKWGKIYRSGSLLKMTNTDSIELDNLSIKSIIDLRSSDTKIKSIDRYSQANHIRIPIAHSGYASISQKILDGHFLRGDAVIFTQDIYKDIVNNYTEELSQFFDYLCDESNYPIVYQCFLGKDQSGLATYFLLKALDIPVDELEDDYMASEKGIDRHKLFNGADSLSESRQEAFTMLTNTDLSYLKYAISSIRDKSGSVDEYLLKELKLTPDKRKKLKSILLYNE